MKVNPMQRRNRATMGATKGSSAPVPSCPILSYGSGGDEKASEGVCGTHNAGVGSSSLPPATYLESAQAPARSWVRSLARFFVPITQRTSATTGATKRPGIVDYKSDYRDPPSVYDPRGGLMPLAFYCARWAL